MKVACCLAVLLTSTIGIAADRKLKLDRFGDPLPAGAVHRLGTTRFRHFGDAMSIEYSADGKFLAASSKAGSVFVWECATGRVIRVISISEKGRKWEDHVQGIAMSPDNRTLAVAMAQRVNLYEFRKGKRLKVMPLPAGDWGDCRKGPHWHFRTTANCWRSRTAKTCCNSTRRPESNCLERFIIHEWAYRVLCSRRTVERWRFPPPMDRRLAQAVLSMRSKANRR